MKKQRIVIAGCGPGGIGYVTPEARREIEQAEVLVGAPRLLEMFPEIRAERVMVGADIEKALARLAVCRKKRVVVLVTGDPGLCSFAKPVIRRFGRQSCRVIPGVSSIQAAFAAVGMDWLDARIVTAHNGVPKLDPSGLVGVRKLAVLAGDSRLRPWLSKVAAVMKPCRIFICTDLTLPDECVREIRAAALGRARIAARSVILLIGKEEMK